MAKILKNSNSLRIKREKAKKRACSYRQRTKQQQSKILDAANGCINDLTEDQRLWSIDKSILKEAFYQLDKRNYQAAHFLLIPYIDSPKYLVDINYDNMTITVSMLAKGVKKEISSSVLELETAEN
jgi:hypothetical protein